MNVRILFLLLVSKAIKCDKIAESRTSIVLTIDDKCKNIKCSAQEDPICVKIKHVKDIKKVFYVIALNKCELQFMKCHKDYEANIVAMKLCEHENIIKKTQNRTVTRRGRVKRSIFRRDSTTRVHDVFDSTSSEAGGGVKVIPDHVYDEKHVLSLKNTFSQEEYSGHKINIDDIYDDHNNLSTSGKQAGLYLQAHNGGEKANMKKALYLIVPSDRENANKKKGLYLQALSDGEKANKNKALYLIVPSDREKANEKKGLSLQPPNDGEKANKKEALYLIVPTDREKANKKKGLYLQALGDGEKANKNKALYLIVPSDREKANEKKGLYLQALGDGEKANKNKALYLIVPSDREKANEKKDLFLIVPSDGEKSKKEKGLKLVLNNSKEKEKASELKLEDSVEEEVQFSGESLLEEIAPDEFHLFSKETIAERKNNADDSVSDNSDECPDSCPAHTDMICVKCLHGVYKTFPSTCHLRQYCCSNGGESRRVNRRTEPNEKEENKAKTMSGSRASEIRKQKDLCKDIELVSRHSCILSAPFIDSAGVTSRGRVYNQNANDVILGYIKCKSLDLLGKSDPRCPF